MNSDDESRLQRFIKCAATTHEEASKLVSEGFTTIEEIAYVPAGELSAVLGGDTERVATIRAAARKHVLGDIEW